MREMQANFQLNTNFLVLLNTHSNKFFFYFNYNFFIQKFFMHFPKVIEKCDLNQIFNQLFCSGLYCIANQLYDNINEAKY
jgi:hypothetical protein